MFFHTISCVNFRNLKDTVKVCNKKDIFLVGKNGQGKTNFLEVIYLLCYGSSFRVKKESLLYKDLNHEIVLIGDYLYNHQINKIELKINKKEKKFYLNGKRIQDRKDIIKYFPCVIFSYEDINYIKGPPEKKRNFLDQTLILYNICYIDLIREYKKILTSRNSLFFNKEMINIDFYNKLLINYGIEIQKQREMILSEINTAFTSIFYQLTNIKVVLKYMPSWNSFLDTQIYSLMQSSFYNDNKFKTTTRGPHRDTFIFEHNKEDFAKKASTGQIRLLSIVLKIAQANIIFKKVGKQPILLIDDIFLELDIEKRKKIVSFFPEYQQAFYTFLPEETYFNIKPENKIFYNIENGELIEKCAMLGK